MSFMQSGSSGGLPSMLGQMAGGNLQGQMGSSRPEMDKLLSGISNMQSPSFAPPEKKPGYDWGALLERLGAASNQFAQMGGAQPMYQPQPQQEQPRMNLFQNMFDRNR
jgi:hypothetical protein